MAQRRPGRLKLFYKQGTGREHGVGVGSIPGRPPRILLYSSWRTSHSVLVWSWWGQRVRRAGCYLIPTFARSSPQLRGVSEQLGLIEPTPPFSILWLCAWAQNTPFGRVCRHGSVVDAWGSCALCAVPLPASISCACGLASHLRVAPGSLLLAAPSSWCPHCSDSRRLRRRACGHERSGPGVPPAPHSQSRWFCLPKRTALCLSLQPPAPPVHLQ